MRPRRGYDRRWRKIRRAYLAAHPFCVVCGASATVWITLMAAARGVRTTGRIVGVVGGRRFEVSFQALSGDVRTEFPVTPGRGEMGPTGRLGVKSMSGDIAIHPAPER